LKLFSGNANRPLAAEIAKLLNIKMGAAEVKTFSDGEIAVEIGENIRGCDVFVIQSTSNPGNDNLMELLIIMDALKRASSKRITAVLPYYGYARQDRKVKPRTPITAKLVADLLTAAGASRVLCVDLHAGQIQGFFDIPVDNLYATPVILDYIRDKYARNGDDIVMVSPDAGGVERARAFAKRVEADLAIIDKRRERANEVESMRIIGEVEGRTAFLLDDMVDTAGTLTTAAKALTEAGATRVVAACTHGVLSGPAIKRLNDSVIEEVIVTNSIDLGDKAAACPKLTVLSVAPLLAEAIRRIFYHESVSSLFV
ncbi:MAG: ribose-phosphate pyrophosphokinase, partial [Candidatus Methylomirabilis sp.]|nr:ribose-phosphate pyrophosphokinase [Deltaproteobacteria bacterium]